MIKRADKHKEGTSFQAFFNLIMIKCADKHKKGTSFQASTFT